MLSVWCVRVTNTLSRNNVSEAVSLSLKWCEHKQSLI